MPFDELNLGHIPLAAQPFPFSFLYDGRPCGVLLPDWTAVLEPDEPIEKATRRVRHWTEPSSGLRVQWEALRYHDFPACEWLISLENTGSQTTAMIEDIQVLDVTFETPINGTMSYRVYETAGGPARPTDFEAHTVVMKSGDSRRLSSGGGRSSSEHFPFFKIETGRGSAVFALGWSGAWAAEISCPGETTLRATAGMQTTHFRLYPGERVRMPRVLLLFWDGDTWEANARFRQLIYRHYAAKRSGKTPLPVWFCNTAFTRGGGWLNECNAQNQISLINAYAPLGLEALLTDAGWFEGGWPSGAGNWNPRPEAYPEGMGPVAKAAQRCNMIYGLWFEPERVVAGTWLHRNRPQWLLAAKAGGDTTFLLNFGLPEVQQYFFDIVKGFMDLPGFRFYRQDFNMDPLPYWRENETEDRQGMLEIRYIEGLYAFWDRIAATWPDSLREECASGGNRIDLETVMRMHLHQKSDLWFQDTIDQASLWGLSQYLPNNVLVAHLATMDRYAFLSTLPSSLCLGWIADATDFDLATARLFAERYRSVRHLLIGAWYPLLSYSRAEDGWHAVQFHRSDLDEGLILAYRRPQCPDHTVQVALRGLVPEGQYALESDLTGAQQQYRGAALMAQLELALPTPRSADLIRYWRVKK